MDTITEVELMACVNSSKIAKSYLEVIDNESLGGAKVQSNISGVTDYIMKNDEECIEQIRSLVSKFGRNETAGFDRIESKLPMFSPNEIPGVLPEDTIKPYNTYDILSRIVDDSEIDEYKAGYGKTLITAYGRIDGWAVGIVANQRSVVKNEQGEMQVGGVIYSDSADKATRFIMNCNQKKIPLIFLLYSSDFPKISPRTCEQISKNFSSNIYLASLYEKHPPFLLLSSSHLGVICSLIIKNIPL
jgi:acetyl-CoA carboxylase carboxyltransferase component